MSNSGSIKDIVVFESDDVIIYKDATAWVNTVDSFYPGVETTTQLEKCGRTLPPIKSLIYRKACNWKLVVTLPISTPVIEVARQAFNYFPTKNSILICPFPRANPTCWFVFEAAKPVEWLEKQTRYNVSSIQAV